MDCQNYITEVQERKRGQHLQREDRGAIQRLKRLGYSNRAIAREIGCSPTTIGNELRRGTPPRQGDKGKNSRILRKARPGGLQRKQNAQPQASQA